MLELRDLVDYLTKWFDILENPQRKDIGRTISFEKKSICFFTGSRSEYNLIKNLYFKFKSDKSFK